MASQFEKSVNALANPDKKGDNGSTEVAKTKVQAFDDAVPRALTVLLLDVEKNEGAGSIITSYDSTTRDGAMRRERHECDVEENGEKYINTNLDIVAFTCAITEMANENGEFSHVPVLTLELANGDLLNLFSAPVLRCFIARLRTHFIDGPLDDKHPITLRLVKRQTQAKRSMYWLMRP